MNRYEEPEKPRSTIKLLKMGLVLLTLASATGLAFALPGSAQDVIVCFRIVESGDGAGIETSVGPPPCPEGFTEAPDEGTPAATTTTTAPAPAETTTTVAPAETATTVAEAETTTTTAAPDALPTDEAPPAEAVPGDPNYTG